MAFMQIAITIAQLMQATLPRAIPGNQ